MIFAFKIFGAIGLIVSLLLSATVPDCMAFDRKVEIIPFLGGRAGGSFKDGTTEETLRVDHSTVYGLSIDVDYDPGRQLQFFWSRQNTSFRTPSILMDELKLNIDYYHFGGTFCWDTDSDFAPYVTASIGATHFQPVDSDYDDELRFSMSIGMGVKYFFTSHIGWMLEGRGYGTFMGGSTAIFCGGGCTILIDQELYGQFEGRTGLVIRF
jgi:opacity protein-like surface antigen